MQQIPINDMARHSASVHADVKAAIERVLLSGWYVLGQEVSFFEEEFANACGTHHCIGVANGTDAIELGLRAIGIDRGHRVATVANAGFYVCTALQSIGAIPVFVDIDPTNHLMNISDLSVLVQQRKIDAVVITHLYGLMHDMATVMDIADRTGIAVFEDCAQAHGARRGSDRAGACGHAASFSFYPTKNLGAVGDGGAVTTNDADVATRVRRLRQYGWEGKYRVLDGGARNSRLDEVQAAVLRAKLPRLDGWNSRRRAIAGRYAAGIHHPRVTCPGVDGEANVAHLYVITTENREDLRRHLREVGIASDVHYPVPDHLQTVMQGRGAPPWLPVTEKLAGSILTLPCFPELTDAEVEQVVAAVNSW